MSKKLIVVGQDVFGVDIGRLYELACYSAGPPQFQSLYEEYKLDVLNTNLNLSVEAIEEQIRLLKSGMVPKENMNHELSLKPEAELYYYLITNHFSFINKNKLLNSPIKGVW